MPLPQDVLARLASLSGYDQMLEMDAVSRNHGVGIAEIESQLAATKQERPTTNLGRLQIFPP